MELEHGQFLPRVDPDRCNQCGLCRDCCPGLNMDPFVLAREPLTPAALSGPVQRACTARLADLSIRRTCTSGGLATGLIMELLGLGRYDAAFVLQFDAFEGHPARLEASRDPAEVLRAAKSKYVPASVYNVVRAFHGTERQRYIVVATSCQLRAIREAMAARRAPEDDHLFLGLFCDRTMSFNFLRYVEDRWGQRGEKLRSFDFRTKEDAGHPGNCKAVFHSGRTVFIHRSERLKVKTAFQLRRCLCCLDKLNAAADISLGDCYVPGQADFWGKSSVIVRSSKGQRAFEACSRAIVTEDEPMANILDSQDLAGHLANLDYARIIMQKAGVRTATPDGYVAPAPAARQLAALLAEIERGRTYPAGWPGNGAPGPAAGAANAVTASRAFVGPLLCLAECAAAGTFRRRPHRAGGGPGHVIILGAGLENKGSQAMLFTVVDQVRRRSPSRGVYVFSDSSSLPRDQDLYRFSFVPWDPVTRARVSSRLARMRSGRSRCTDTEREILGIIRDAACFIDISGFAVSTQWGRTYYDPLFSYLTNILIARRGSVPFFVFPQSMGPLDYPGPARALLFPIMKLAFSYPRRFYLRERECLEHVRPYTTRNVAWSPDIVLQGSEYDLSNIYTRVPTAAPVTVPPGSVALIPSQRVLERSDEGRLYSLYSSIIRGLLAAGRNIFIVRHAREDLDLCARIKSLFCDEPRVQSLADDMSCVQLETATKQFDFVVASRYHSLVHAYKHAVPALAIGWSYKYSSLMAELGQSALYFDCRGDLDSEGILGALNGLTADRDGPARVLADRMQLLKQGGIFDDLGL